MRPMACGQCIGCRLEYSRQWATRIVHESKLYDVNSFVLLTFRESMFSLDYSYYQLFMKRLRKHFAQEIRFFMSGEYGSRYGRPHFHAALFNCGFSDKVYLKKSDAGFNLYRSATLEKLWPHGHASIGDLSFESAAYIARYVTKKITGDQGVDPEILEILDPDTGEMWFRRKEFARMSLRPGIGARWLDKFWSDVYPTGKVLSRGVESRAPRYYDKRLRERGYGKYAVLSSARKLEGVKHFPESFPDRLVARETVAKARLSLFKRKGDYDA